MIQKACQPARLAAGWLITRWDRVLTIAHVYIISCAVQFKESTISRIMRLRPFVQIRALLTSRVFSASSWRIAFCPVLDAEELQRLSLSLAVSQWDTLNYSRPDIDKAARVPPSLFSLIYQLRCDLTLRRVVPDKSITDTQRSGATWCAHIHALRR